MTDRLEQPGDGVAVAGAAGVAGVERPGGVGADELDVDRDAGAVVVAAETLGTRSDDGAQHVVQPGVAESEVDEPRARDLDGLDVGDRCLRQLGDELGGHLAGDCGRPPWPWPARRWTTSRRARAEPGRSRRDGIGRGHADGGQRGAQGVGERVGDHERLSVRAGATACEASYESPCRHVLDPWHTPCAQ